MLVWNMNQIVDEQFRLQLLNHIDELRGPVILELSDGRIKVSQRQALINLFLWQMITAFGKPICKHHYIKRMHITRDSLSEELDKYYDELCMNGSEDLQKFKMVLWKIYSDLYQMCCDHLQQYAASIDMIDLATIMLDPKMKPILDTKEKIDITWGTKAIEKFVDINSKKVSDLLKIAPGTEYGLSSNALYPYHVLGQVNKFQLPQTMYAFSVRTDVNDAIVNYPVVGSAIDGLRNINEYAVESLSAKKSSFYNHGAVSNSQYFGRRQHLIASSVSRIYAGDCGTKVTVPFYVTDDAVKNIVGKYIVEDGKLVLITKFTAKDYLHKTIMLRSPMTCRHRNGVCEICGGRIIQALNKFLNIGILSAMQVVSPATQKILSAKHLVKTNSILYHLPTKTTEVLMLMGTNSITWSKDFKARMSLVKVGIPIEYFARFDTIPELKRNEAISSEILSQVNDFWVEVNGVRTQYSLQADDGNVPSLSEDMLFHIHDNYGLCVQEDNIIWVPMNGTSRVMSIFTASITNDSTLAYVKKLTSFLKSNVASFTSCQLALKGLTDLMYEKASTNIAYLEVLLKAYEITNSTDYRIPEVKDQELVRFGKENTVIKSRTMGGELAFQELSSLVSDPKFYLVPRQRSPFDAFTVGNDPSYIKH